ncbi:MAG: fluoride efflux transporter CrcB [Sulfurospirillum sp.]|nr:MAG: fluoride efflux transporter CrcB [Sulfurospirillum sp.]
MLYSQKVLEQVVKLLLFVGVGGFFGAICRYLVSSFLQTNLSSHFPVGTLGVNIIGSFLIGFLAFYFQSHSSPEFKLMIITGFLGALTTFSTFSFESIMLIDEGMYIKALSSIFLNLTLSLLATMSAIALYKKLFM